MVDIFKTTFSNAFTSERIIVLLLTLYVLNLFYQPHKHVFATSIVHPYWYDMSSWNPSSWKTMVYLFYIISIMGADGLATQGARASTIMTLTLLNLNNSVPAC